VTASRIGWRSPTIRDSSKAYPRTGATVQVPAKRVVTFKPGLEMEQRLQ
jgi:nucleoid DNA-binding protein